jgi:hypothetical protein
MQTSGDRNLVNVDIGTLLKIKDCGGEASYLWVNTISFLNTKLFCGILVQYLTITRKVAPNLGKIRVSH